MTMNRFISAKSEQNICIITFVTPFPAPIHVFVFAFFGKELRAFKDRHLKTTFIIIIIL